MKYFTLCAGETGRLIVGRDRDATKGVLFATLAAKQALVWQREKGGKAMPSAGLLTPTRVLILVLTLLGVAARLVFPVTAIDWAKATYGTPSNRVFWLTHPVPDMQATLLHVGAIFVLGAAVFVATFLPQLQVRRPLLPRLSVKRVIVWLLGAAVALAVSDLVATQIQRSWQQADATTVYLAETVDGAETTYGPFAGTVSEAPKHCEEAAKDLTTSRYPSPSEWQAWGFTYGESPIKVRSIPQGLDPILVADAKRAARNGVSWGAWSVHAKWQKPGLTYIPYGTRWTCIVR